MTDNRTTELLKDYAFALRRLEYAVDKPGSNMTLGEYEAEEKRVTDEYAQAIAATLGSDASAIRFAERLRGIADEMRNVGASTMTPHELLACYASDVDKVADLLMFAATLNGVNPDGLPNGLTTSDDGNLLNWRGENYVKQSTLGNGTLTAEQVRESIEKRFGLDVWVPKERWQAIADELNTELGSGTCELDYDRHCSNCGVHVHEDAVLVRKHLDGGT